MTAPLGVREVFSCLLGLHEAPSVFLIHPL